VSDARAFWAAARGAESGRELATSLSNRAAVWLAAGEACHVLNDTWEVMELLQQPGSREWQRLLRAWGAWVPAVYSKAVLRRAAALELLSGDASAALSALAWLAARPDATEDMRQAAARAAAGRPRRADGALRAAWMPLLFARASPAPQPRRGAACAALEGALYVFGGDCSSSEADCPSNDLWRLHLPPPGPVLAASLRWERVQAASPPPPCRRAAALAAASQRLLVVVDSRLDVHTFSPQTCAWAKLGSMLAEGSPPTAADLPLPSLALGGDYVLALSHAGGEWWLARLPLGGGKLERARLPPGPSLRRDAHFWLGANNELRLFGGAEDAPRGVPGHAVHGPCGAPLNELWELSLAGIWAGPAQSQQERSWTRVTFDGGGAPPPPRAATALVPLGGGRALLCGGWSEAMPEALPVYTGAQPAARYAADAYMFDPGQNLGWRRLSAEGEEGEDRLAPQPAGRPLIALDAASRRLFWLGGEASHPPSEPGEGLLPLIGGVFELLVSADAGSASAADAAAASAAGQLWHRLRCGAQVAAGGPRAPPLNAPYVFGSLSPEERRFAHEFARNVPGLGAGWEPSPAAFDARLAAARAAPRAADGAEWHVSWSCLWISSTPPQNQVYRLSLRSVTRNEGPPGRSLVDALLGPREPGAPDAAWSLLSAAAAERCRPRAILLAARCGRLYDSLLPLARALSTPLLLQSWGEAGGAARRSGACPFGLNAVNEDAPRRCTACGALEEAGDLRGAVMRACAACRAARYCSPECCAADAEAHAPLCAALRGEGVGGARHAAYAFSAPTQEDAPQDGSARGVWLPIKANG